MPRNPGTGVYTKPSPDVITGTTIESAVYNTFVGDVETDLNTPRPIVAGGTGSNTAAGALANLGAVAKAGDTMTGDLKISKVNPLFQLDKTASAQGSFLVSTMATKNRWALLFGDTQPESGSNIGSNFTLSAYDDAGNILFNPLSIIRATGKADIRGPLQVGTSLAVALSAPVQNQIISTNILSTSHLSINCYYSDSPVGFKGLYTGLAAGDLSPTAAGLNLSITGATVTAGSPATFAFNWVFGINGTFASPGGITCAKSTLSAVYTGAAIQIGYIGAAGGIALRPSVDTAYPVLFVNASDATVGSINTTATTTSYVTSSDARLKEDLKSFDAGNIVDATEVYDFKWKNTDERAFGIIAQQAKDVYPTAVSYEKTADRYGIDYSKYVPVIMQELKALRARVAELESRLEAGAQPA